MKTLAFACIIFAVCISARYLEETPFLKCNEEPIPLSLRVIGCTVIPCKFHEGELMSAEVDFRVHGYVRSLSVYAMIVNGVSYLHEDTDACVRLLNNKCPLHDSEVTTYKFYMVPPNYPVTVEFMIFDQDNHLQVCFALAFDK